MKEDAGWGGSASFEGKSFDSVHWFGCEGCFKVSPAFKYVYSDYLKVLLWFVFAIYVFFLFMVNWKEVYSEPYLKSEAELFAKQVNNLKPLIFLKKNTLSWRLKGFWIHLSCMKSKLQVLLYIAISNSMYLLPFQYN